MRNSLTVTLIFLLALSGRAVAHIPPGLVEPTLHIAPGSPGSPRVALTFDACTGHTDMRILSALIRHRIPATIFVSGRWLRYNKRVFGILRSHADLFEVEDHGHRHLPAVDKRLRIYGIESAGSAAAVRREVEGGANDIVTAGGKRPTWFRGATAYYTPSAITEIRHMGFRVAGFSINGDGGARFSAATVERIYDRARNGDVLISHINQPNRPAGAGVVKGILDLKAKGFHFVRLEDAGASGNDDSTAP